jgi:type I restriction enzyme S subunit
MEVKPGYKKTEIGEIPEAWETTTIGALGDTSSGTTPPRALSERYYKNGSISWVKTLDLNNKEIFATEERVTHAALTETSLEQYGVGTVLVAMYGGFKQIGRTGLLRIDATVNQAITAIRTNRNRLLPEYLLWVLNCRVEYWKTVASSSRKDPNITGKEIRDFPLAVPGVKEQEAIAEALSDADALIDALEQLVAKKRQIKQGAMQELLIGKKRLPEFHGKWTQKPLGDLGRWVGGMTPLMRNPAYWTSATVPWVSSGDVKSIRLTSTAFSITQFAIKQGTTTLLPARSIIVVTRSGILRRHLPVAMNMMPMAINQDVKALLENGSVSTEYVLHSLIANGPAILARCMKSGTTVESIELGWLKAFTIPLPPTTEEQEAVAAIITDMDAEIAALEAKLAKARHVKQGMMQELLTGRVRLCKASRERRP